jgi:hypothetical protein
LNTIATTTRKVFCIGSNKTGTTSMGAALESLGFRLGNQWEAELLIDNWAQGDFDTIIDYCNTADAFQDVPFSLPSTYAELDRAFPDAKFILTVRNSADEWFDSLTRFHTKLIGKGRLPTADDLREFDYHGPGWLWHAHVLIHGVDESTLYHREHYTRLYESHCRNVAQYFAKRPADLLVLNLRDSQAMHSLCTFLGLQHNNRPMPHLNRSR